METEPEKSEYRAFKSLLGRVLAVSREEMQRREAEYQERTKLKGKRGPKPKQKTKADSH